MAAPLSAIGVDVGGSKILAVAADRTGRVLAERRSATPRGAAAMLDTVASLVTELVEATADGVRRSAQDPWPPVGVGVPGLVEARTGVLVAAPNLPEVAPLDVRQGLASRLAFAPTLVDNDATCAGAAEHACGAAKGASDALLVTLGTGIGGGIVANGRVVRGAVGFAGEVGHMVVDPDGPACPCGRRGCWERFASGGALARLAEQEARAGRARALLALAGGDPRALRGEHVTAAAARGDAEALGLVAEVARWLAIGLANLAAILDPEVVVLGGGLSEAGEVLLGPTRRALASELPASRSRRPFRLVRAELGERAGAVGAALLAASESPVPEG